MIQDIFPRVYHNEYRDMLPEGSDFILVFFKNTVLVRYENGKLRYPARKEMSGYQCDYYYLFSIDHFQYFLAYLPDKSGEDIPFISLPGYSYEHVSIFRTADSRHTAFAGITGHHLFNWYQTNQFCGRCGERLAPDHRERMLYCSSCKNTVYPKIAPAVTVGLINKDKLLMSKYAGRPYTKYALLAGFTEIGESAEQTVEREVMEEVGLRVKNIRYYKSQPWAFSGSLLLGFFAELDGTDEITLDTSELAEAGWFTRDEITLEDDSISLTREMICRFKDGLV